MPNKPGETSICIDNSKRMCIQINEWNVNCKCRMSGGAHVWMVGIMEANIMSIAWKKSELAFERMRSAWCPMLK